MNTTMVSPVQKYLEVLHGTLLGLDDGAVATYIPELAKAKKSWFGICLATVDGQIYEVGDTGLPFTIQSISKPFVYGAALAAHGKERVGKKVGVEPSGDAFNAISLAPVTGIPANPMINAGAISSSGLLLGKDLEEKRTLLLEGFSRYTGVPLTVDEAVYRSERDTGFRNYAIGFMLRNFGILEVDPVTVLDLYFQQCSILVTCRDLAVMAATLANDGMNPLTGVQALPRHCTTDVLSVMATCGMYDYSGAWTYEVGLPAKSGVAGGILAVLPGKMGIGIYSPALDERGNSVRGIAVCKELSRNLGLHLFRVARSERSVVRRSYTAAAVPSNRERLPRTRELLGKLGERIVVHELQEALTFATAEAVVRRVLHEAPVLDLVVLDLSRVMGVEDSAADLLGSLALRLWEQEKRLILSTANPATFAVLSEALNAKSPDGERLSDPSFADIDLALEWCENHVLKAAQHADAEEQVPVPLEKFSLLAGLDSDSLELLRRIIRRVVVAPGETIIQKGDRDNAIYLLAKGEVSVVIPLAAGRQKRVATFSAGMFFGEMALLEDAVRSATISADQDAECYVLDKAELGQLWDQQPRMKGIMMSNMALTLAHRLRKTNGTIAALAW